MSLFTKKINIDDVPKSAGHERESKYIEVTEKILSLKDGEALELQKPEVGTLRGVFWGIRKVLKRTGIEKNYHLMQRNERYFVLKNTDR